MCLTRCVTMKKSHAPSEREFLACSGISGTEGVKLGSPLPAGHLETAPL